MNRDISNLFLIASVLLALVNYKELYSEIKNNKLLFLSIILLATWFSAMIIYMEIPLSYIDNYSRLLIIFPLITIKLKLNQFKLIIYACSIAAILHFLYTYNISEVVRYGGTSSHPITYACMIVTLICLLMYFLDRQTFANMFLTILLIGSLVIIWIHTETRGPAIGLILVLVLLIFRKKNLMFLSVLPILAILIIYPNDLSKKFQSLIKVPINNISIENIKMIAKSDNANNISTRYRIAYILCGIDIIKNNFFTGVGPQNIEAYVTDCRKKNKYNIHPQSHLHNDFLDLAAKFGIPSLMLLLLFYFTLFKSSHSKYKILSLIIIIFFTSSQLTQSQFAHHQAVVFYFTMLYIFVNNRIEPKIKE